MNFQLKLMFLFFLLHVVKDNDNHDNHHAFPSGDYKTITK